MTLLVTALALLLGGALLSALLWRRPAWAAAAYRLSLTLGCVLGLFPALAGLSGAELEPFRAAWPVPLGEFALGLDALSAFFLVLVLAVCLAAGLYAETYIGHSPALAGKPQLRPFYLLLTASLAAVVAARNAVLFLLAWEVMALASFFLIAAEHEDPGVRRAGLLFFACTHTASLALFLLFAVLGQAAGTLDLDGMRAAAAAAPALPLLALALAFLAFGMKAGLFPLHVWLQEAHPAAPSHVSAVMSGVVIKMGIYGFLRTVWLLKTVPASWAVFLIAAGAVSGIGGVLFALAQHDLKRLLAYHSIENIGIISLGLGLGCLGLARQAPGLAVLGFTGAVLHTLNHALFKSLLFLGSGAFAHALGTRDIESGGGLLRRMPQTSALSLVGAAAICGIPPLNGFVSEWLVYLASFYPGPVGGARLSAVAAVALALIGGLAIACFTKAYGALCLGEPRTERAAAAKDPGAGMTVPMAALAAACAVIGLWPGPFVLLAGRAAATAAGLAWGDAEARLVPAITGATWIGRFAVAALALTGALALARARLVRGRARTGPTWGCGFTRPTPRLQYTASSYAEPLTRLFQPVLATETHALPPSGYWPAAAAFESHTPDRVLDGWLLPAASAATRALTRLKRAQHSRLQYYLLYVALTLIALLFWGLAA